MLYDAAGFTRAGMLLSTAARAAAPSRQDGLAGGRRLGRRPFSRRKPPIPDRCESAAFGTPSARPGVRLRAQVQLAPVATLGRPVLRMRARAPRRIHLV